MVPVSEPMKIAILGPTASGKSALAAAVAQRVGGFVVNGDPFQAFRDLPIGTGQPREEERAGVPHEGYGVLALDVPLNPDSFGQQVRLWLASRPAPVLVTGSGLYLRGIWGQLSDLPEVSAALTARVRHWAQTLPSPALHRFLKAVDPARAAQLHPNDHSRIQRALALHLATGRRPSQLLDGVERGVPEGWRALLVLPARDRQRQRVTARVKEMLRQGWPAEVARLREAGHEAELRRLRPLGYDALMDLGRGAPSRIILDTMAYAKRQGTWFRNQWPEIPTWDPDADSLETALERLGI
jgi:tRNA dimethylallyltransferase